MGQNFSSEPVVEKDTEKDHNDVFNVAVSSCQGWRTSQEDNHSLILDLPGPHKASLFAVYDGHGSAKVSKHASESLWKHLTENEAYKKGDFKQALESAFLTFDREVNESYNAQLAGTTAVCILIVDNIVYCANIGDSRSVASVDCECKPLSYDHKPENPTELKRILAAGGYVLGNRVNGNLALSRAFGDFHYKGNEQLPPEQQIVSPCPDIQCIDLNDEVDFIVLACDGIWDVLSSEEVVRFVIDRLERSIEPATICEQLTTRCLATDYELVIGCDNMTVLLVCYTRGRSWEDYCTDIFNKHTKKLGLQSRPRVYGTDDLDQVENNQRPSFHSQQQSYNAQSQEEQQISSNNLSPEQQSGDDESLGTDRASSNVRGGSDSATRALLNMFESLGLGRFELGAQDGSPEGGQEYQSYTNNIRSTFGRVDHDDDNDDNNEDEDRCRIEEVVDDDENGGDDDKTQQAKDDSCKEKALDNTDANGSETTASTTTTTDTTSGNEESQICSKQSTIIIEVEEDAPSSEQVQDGVDDENMCPVVDDDVDGITNESDTVLEACSEKEQPQEDQQQEDQPQEDQPQEDQPQEDQPQEDQDEQQQQEDVDGDSAIK